MVSSASTSRSSLALRYDWRNNAVVVVHNLADASRRTMRLRSDDEALGDDDDEVLVNLLAEDHSRGNRGHHVIALEPYGYRWYRAGGLDYLLRRSDVDV